jgi:arylsulfatase
MVEDRTELNDLAEVNRPQVKKMVAAWEEWADRCGILPWAEVLERRKQMHG